MSLETTNLDRSNAAKNRIDQADRAILPLLTSKTTLLERRKMVHEQSGATDNSLKKWEKSGIQITTMKARF
jgi:hypothetical protein